MTTALGGPWLGTVEWAIEYLSPRGADTGRLEDAYLAALEVACETIARFGPATLVVSLGFDTFERDPLGTFGLVTSSYGRIGERLAELVLPTLLVQEGGYALDALGANAVTLLGRFQTRA